MGETLIHVYSEGVHYSLIADREGLSVFGGPQERKISGIKHGPHRIHQVAELHGRDIPALTDAYVFGLPLLYGFRFDGCFLRYRFSTNDVEVLEIRPAQSSEDWPYQDYPPLLPYVPIRAIESAPKAWEAFAESFPNLADEQPTQLVAVVEPPLSLGFSMWGKSGDLEGVCVVFECDLREKTVASYNICG